MPFEWFAPKYRRDPNAMVHSLYHGVAGNNKIVTRIIKPDADGNRMEATRVYEPGLERGQGGNIATLIIGGMETTLDEMEDILAAKKDQKWVPRRSNSDIAEMCRHLMEMRNEKILEARKNPSTHKQPPKPAFYLPVGVRMVDTPIPGLKIVSR